MAGEELTDPPEVAKRKVRKILRQARDRGKLTQREAADRVLWSLSKLVRIESGVTLPAPGDVRSLLLEYDATDRLDEAVALLKAARLPDEWDAFKDIFSGASRHLFANEQAADVIMKYEPTLVPGLLQTEEYARALLISLGSDPKSVERRVAARKRRQEILESPDCPTLQFIIGEATISRPVGGKKVMLDQIRKLAVMAGHPRMTLMLLPFSAGAHAGMGNAFTILEFKDSDLADLVYLESADRESIVREDLDEVEKYNTRFAQLRDIATGPEEFLDQLNKISRYRFDEDAVTSSSG